MPSIKELLKVPLALPKSIEATLPAGIPQISSILGSFVDGLPAGPELPGAAALPTAAPQLPRMPAVTEFIKSIETGLPVGLPKFGQGNQGGNNEVPPAPTKAPKLVFE